MRKFRMIMAAIMMPAKAINIISEKMKEERIVSRITLVAIALIVGFINVKEGCFSGNGAVVNIIVFGLVIILLKKTLNFMEDILAFILEILTWLPSRIFEYCVK